MPLDRTSNHLDLLLLGVIVELELSDRDLQVTDKRYLLLKERLERPASPLAEFLPDGEAIIYAQGSRAIGATIVSGTNDDRFDLDAILEFSGPADWSPCQRLDILLEALKSFPDAVDVVRCTRCVQVRFPFMHLDVTPLLPNPEPRMPRAGQICHSPDGDLHGRTVDSNPYGFARWFREAVGDRGPSYATILKDYRSRQPGRLIMRAAEQEELPEVQDGRLDAPQVIALKLMKRYLNRRFEGREDRCRPPSVYLSKKAAQQIVQPDGLCAQLESLAESLLLQIFTARKGRGEIDERNPASKEERLTDRWPRDERDLELAAMDLRHLIGELERARESELREIANIFEDLFGERVTSRTVEKYAEMAAGRASAPAYVKRSGAALGGAAATAPSTAGSPSKARGHHFHAGGGLLDESDGKA